MSDTAPRATPPPATPPAPPGHPGPPEHPATTTPQRTAASHRTATPAPPATTARGRRVPLGTDPRAVRHSPAPGRPDLGHLADTPRVAVIGGGIAGLAAAAALADRGARVEVWEREAGLGGRLAGWETRLRDGSRVTMTRGFHAFFRQYYNLRRLLRRADPALEALTPLPDYPLLHGTGARDSFAGLPRTPPWSALAFVARSPTFGWRDLAAMAPGPALELFDVSVPRVYQRLDALDAPALLDAVRFPPAARHLAFEVFSRSFFAHPRRLSAAELATMFHIYFLGSAEGLLFDVPRDPFPQALWEPLATHLTARGVTFRTGAAVDRIDPARTPGRHSVVPAGGGARDYDAVVLAADAPGLRRLVAASPRLGDDAWRRRIAALPSAPPFQVTRLWLDRPVAADRPAFLGTGGFGPLDNITVLERYERQARRWARRTGGSVVELHGYALPEDTEAGEAARRLRAELHRVYPETADARVLDERHELRADCPLFPPGGWPHRPTVRTPDPTVVLAGDLVRVDLPVALMERAATSGTLAANALLERWGAAGHPVWTVPTAGRSPLLRALARVARRAGPHRASALSAGKG
ncbi:FAD-dependent oxidoreductase [Allostreptomyces psammosilenae]|uniref:Isorenieratene synthase n=1 Tax=Allostreptomyces psammosilenae TaxID=1892865 RepID=A0A852ZMJ2_9ACTN|nr:FAD-dependent oxidoreductase [Allostreptomyces psammosilenae]NYI03619.1 isorenieratene synthase [Allostreptomyces psammosilenae]